MQQMAANALQHIIAPMLSPGSFPATEAASGWDTYYDDPYYSGSRSNRPTQLLDRLEADTVMAMAEAAFALGVLRATGMLPSVQKDDKQAGALYALSAMHNSVSGNLAMAHRYEQGFGVPKSCSLAYQHLKVPLGACPVLAGAHCARQPEWRCKHGSKRKLRTAQLEHMP